MIYRTGPLLNQGSDRTCVGHGPTAELLAKPNTDANADSKLGHKFSLNLYKRTRVIGGTDPEDLQGGAYLQDAMTALKERDLIAEYYWSDDILDIIEAVRTIGPAIACTPWTPSMGNCSADGLVKRGKIERADSGHCYSITGYDPNREFEIDGKKRFIEVFRITNSWGPYWGTRVKDKEARDQFTGSGWIEVNHFSELITASGWYGADSVALPTIRGKVDLAAQLELHPDPYKS